jgi:hypothetical protein
VASPYNVTQSSAFMSGQVPRVTPYLARPHDTLTQTCQHKRVRRHTYTDIPRLCKRPQVAVFLAYNRALSLLEVSQLAAFYQPRFRFA